MTEQTQSAVFGEMWAVVEIMGHSKTAGLISEEAHFGTALLRIDIPNEEGYFTQWYGGNAIYRITPVSEEVARAFASNYQPAPVRPYELALPAPRAADPGDYEEEDYEF